MALQSSGAISLSQVNTELAKVSTSTIGMNDTLSRRLSGKTTVSSSISMSDFYGRANGYADINWDVNLL